MFRSLWPLAMLAAVLAASTTLSTTLARAHEIVGNRFFPATLAIDDPGVNDEVALPTVSISKTGDVPSFKQLDVSGEFAKRITEDFGVSFAPTWSRLYAPGGPNLTGARGFQNLETTFKYRLFKSPEHEFVTVGRSGNRMGRQRCAECRRRTVHRLHADNLLRQRFR